MRNALHVKITFKLSVTRIKWRTKFCAHNTDHVMQRLYQDNGLQVQATACLTKSKSIKPMLT